VFDVAYDTFEVPTQGGDLHVGRWGNGPDVVVAIHGLTLVHSEFHALADQLGPDVTLLAPDLRGRGGSAHLSPPYGIGVHATDVGALLDHVDARSATVLGYSTGAAVAGLVAAIRPERVARVVMVDGGPAPVRTDATEDPRPDPVAHVVERLACTWPSVSAYQDSWRSHPGLGPIWNPYVERLLADELTGEPPELRSSLSALAAVEDAASHLDGREVAIGFRLLRVPVVALRAARNMLDQPEPIFSADQVEQWRALVPQLRDILVPDVNHYSILLTEEGARAVAAALGSHPAAA
jgi:lipase